MTRDMQPVFLLTDGQFKWEHNYRTSETHLWQVLDRLGRQTDCIAVFPQIAQSYGKRSERDLLPLWNEYERLPYGPPPVFEEFFKTAVRLGRFEPLDAITQELRPIPTDGKWSLVGITSGELIGSPQSESLPPVTFHFDTPRGTFKVQLHMMCGWKLDQPISSVSVKAENDAQAHVVVPDEALLRSFSRDRQEKAYRYLDLGTYTIEDGVFDLTISPGRQDTEVQISSLKFIPVGGAQPLSTSNDDLRNEQLRALGYLD